MHSSCYRSFESHETLQSPVQANVVQQASGDAIQLTPAHYDLVLLKGAPGVGKSTAAKLLARHFASGARIEVDVLREMVVDVNWTDSIEHRKVLQLSAQIAAGYLRIGFAPVILVDTFSGDKVDGFLDTFRSECPQGRAFVAVLHASDGVLRDRVLNREVDGFRDLTVSTRLNDEVVRNLRPFETLIGTSTLSPVEVVHAILAAMHASVAPCAAKASELPGQSVATSPFAAKTTTA